MRQITRTAAAAAIAGGLILSQAAVGPAHAADLPAPVEFVAPATLSVEYGEYWSFDVTPSDEFLWYIYEQGAHSVVGTSVPSGYQPDVSMYATASGNAGSLSSTFSRAPLGAGSYTFKITGSKELPPDTYSGETPIAAQLTVTKAQLGIDLRVLADSNNPDGAIVSAEFSGRFVDEYSSSTFDYSAVSPAGEWKITLTDSAGDVVTERSIERAAGDDNLAISFYWTDGEANGQYTANATFTPSGASGANFTVSPATEFSYTAPESGRPTPSSTAPAEAPGALPEPSEFTLPLWALILAGVLVLGLAALVTVFSVRLRKPSAVGAQAVTS